MLSASYFSLLAPAAEISGVVPICGGFLLGAGFVTLADKIIGDVEKPEVFYGKMSHTELENHKMQPLTTFFSSDVKAK